MGAEKKEREGGRNEKKKKTLISPPVAVDVEEAHRLFRGPGGGQEGL